MKRNEIFPSKYLKAADLNGKPITVTIERAALETLKNPDGEEQRKIVLYFRRAQKSFPLNRTNWTAVAAVCGEDTEDWPGYAIGLYPTTTQMQGKEVACIRIRAPAQRELPTQNPAAPKPTAHADMNDEIPF